jgi:hypothetical protein
MKGGNMPSRSQAIIRRQINRLNMLIKEQAGSVPALTAIAAIVEDITNKINNLWQAFQSAVVSGDKERQERDTAIRLLLDWVQSWRPVIMITAESAASNLRSLPAGGATPDDVILVAEDMVKFIESNADMEGCRETAIASLGGLLENARKETSEATAAYPAEAAAREAYSEACIEANTILTRCLSIVRAAFGRTSPEYKQFIARSSAKEEEEIEAESNIGEA